MRRSRLRENDLCPVEGNSTYGPARGDEGFLLVGAVVLVFLLLLALTLAAPKVAREMQREKEIESQHRANQYVRAIRMFYKRNNNYPTSVEQLEKTNQQRFLREKYIDPLTGKDDWRLIHVGENKTKVKGFFGQDLPGFAAGLGSAASLASPTGGSTTGSTAAGSTAGAGAFGATNTSGSAFGNASPGSGSSSAFGSSAGPGATVGPGLTSSSGLTGTSGLPSGTIASGTTASGTTASGTTGTGTAGSGISSQNATDAVGGGGPIMGIGSSKSGEAMLMINDQTTYQTWEFLYDPRIEQLYAKASLLGGAMSSGPSRGLGSASSLASPGAPSTPAAPTALSPGTSPGNTPTPGSPTGNPITPP